MRKKSLQASPLRTNEKGMMQNLWEHRELALMALPVIVLLILFNYIPMFGSLIAFKQFNYIKGFWESPWCGLDNFKFLFGMKDLTWRMIRNTVGYYFLFTATGTVSNIALALALNEVRSRYFAKYSQTLMIMPTFISYVAVSYVLYAFLDTDKGLVNAFLVRMGRDEIKWYYAPQYWPFILTIVNLWKGVGYGSIIYLSALAGMDQELFEAAQLDGATKWQQIRYVTIPLLMPMVSIMLLMGLGGIMSSNTGLFYQVTRNSSMIYSTTQTIDTYVLNSLTTGGATNFGPSSAVSFFQSTVGCLMVVTVNLIVRKIDPESSLF